MSLKNKSAKKPVKVLDIKDKDSLSMFVRDIHKFPLLEAHEEYQLASDWHQQQDSKAAEKLLNSHLRLVHKIAQGYRGYGLALHDLVAEGNIGLMQALHEFDPTKGFRFATYAMWWIRAAIKEHVLKNWSLVKIGTTAAQKKLFFNYKHMRNKLTHDGSALTDDHIKTIAKELGVSEKDVIDMSQRLEAQDYSLNAGLSDVGSEEWQDWLECPQPNQETRYGHEQEMSTRQTFLEKAMQALTEREHKILKYRRLHEPPKTLEDLSSELGLSKERIRQLEVLAFQKIQTEMRKHTENHVYN